MRAVGEIIGRELGRLRSGQSRGPVARASRVLLRRQWRNWRHNGGRPRGRGYDWARTLVAEELLAVAQSVPAEPSTLWRRVDLKGIDLKTRIRCGARSVRREISRLVDRGCVRRLDARGGRGKGLIVEIQPDLLRARVEGRLYRRRDGSSAVQLRFPGPGFAGPIKDPALAGALDSLKQAMEKAAAEGRTPSESDRPEPVRLLLARKTDTSPSLSLPQPKTLTPSAGLASGSEKVGFAGGSQIANRTPKPTAEALRLHSRLCAALDRTSISPLTEPLRRELMRHIRLACWFRGLDPRRTAKICGAAGWTSQAIGKASKRKYLLIDAANWVHAQPRDRLLKVSGSWVTMVAIAKAGFPRRPSQDRRTA